MSLLRVDSAYIPPNSTLGYIVGTDEEGHEVGIAGDQRIVRGIIEALDAGEEVEADYDQWQVVSLALCGG